MTRKKFEALEGLDELKELKPKVESMKDNVIDKLAELKKKL